VSGAAPRALAPLRIGEVRGAERERFGKPLAGLRVLALEQMQALPYATQLLAHLGAEVVKVEHPTRGDAARVSRPLIPDLDGTPVGSTFLRNNLSKQSIGVDLKHPRGRELILRLAPHFDAFAENFQAGAMEELGLGYADVSAVAPKLIYVSVSGFGHGTESPYQTWPAYAPVAEAMAGLYEPTRRPGEPPPVVVAGALGDNGPALFAVIGLLAAIHQRARTRQGQHVDIAMYDSMIAIADMVPFMWSVGEPVSAATAGRTGIVAAFAARDGHFVIAIFREHQFEALCREIGRPEWPRDPRFATRELWAENREALIRPAVEAWARDKTKLEASKLLCALGIPSGPSNFASDIAADPHVAQRNMLIEVERPDSGSPMLMSGNPVKLSGSADGPIARFPRMGEHTDAVLRSRLGLGDAELSELRGLGVISR
jgi:formyl-CoA transferase